jgi:hypothetical protein
MLQMFHITKRQPASTERPACTIRQIALKALYVILTTAALFLLLYRRAYDDPFITYRYADNLRSGVGFVYNPGEQVQSTTTPLFTLLLAGLSFVWGDLPHLANLIGALSLAAGGLLLWELAVIWQAPWAGWAGLLLYPLFPLAITPLGSETPLYIAFCLGAFVAYYRRQYNITAVCAALAVLTRPDGLLVSVILVADFIYQWAVKDDFTRHIPWKAIILFFVISLPWFLFAWIYFGSPLPVTLAVKQQQGAMAVSQRFARGFLSTLAYYKSWRYVLEAVIALAGLMYVIRQARHWLRFLAWPVLYFVAFSVLGVSRYFWYYTPLVPGFLLLAGLGLQTLAGMPIRIPEYGKRLVSIFKDLPEKYHIQTAQVLSILILISLFFTQVRGMLRLRNPDTRFAIYRTAGKWLAANTAADATVGALEVGILGYYAHRPMVDFAGLIRPKVAAQLASGSTYEHAALWTIEYYHPRYLVLFPADFLQLQQDYVALYCRQVKKFAGNQYGYGRNLLVYDCQ